MKKISPTIGWRAVNISNKPAIVICSFEPPTTYIFGGFVFSQRRPGGTKQMKNTKLPITAILIHCITTTNLYSNNNIQTIDCHTPYNTNNRWAATCIKGESEIEIAGIAKCASAAGESDIYSLAPSVTTDPDSEDNTYCWCQIYSPFISQLIYIADFLYQTECENWCGNFCANTATTNQKFRDTIFSKLKPAKE